MCRLQEKSFDKFRSILSDLYIIEYKNKEIRFPIYGTWGESCKVKKDLIKYSECTIWVNVEYRKDIDYDK